MWYENEAIIDCLLKVLDMAFKSCHQTDPSLSQVNEQEISELITYEIFKKLRINNFNHNIFCSSFSSGVRMKPTYKN